MLELPYPSVNSRNSNPIQASCRIHLQIPSKPPRRDCRTRSNRHFRIRTVLPHWNLRSKCRGETQGSFFSVLSLSESLKVILTKTNKQFMDRRKEWNTAFEAYIRELDAKKPVVWTGDLNVAPTAMGSSFPIYRSVSTFLYSLASLDLDIKRSKENYNKSAGHTEIEISAFKRLLNNQSSSSASSSTSSTAKFVDVWRERHPKDHHYSYFGYRQDCRSKGIGWRLDYCEYPPCHSFEGTMT